MIEYQVYNILDLIDSIGEEEVEEILDGFRCPMNAEIENFARKNALSFAKRKISISHLVFDEDANLIAYFTLTHKPVSVLGDILSKTSLKKLKNHAREEDNMFIVSAYLIAQFGKNYGEEVADSISGDDLMDLAFEVLERVQRDVGGGVAFLECEDKAPLLSFYQSDNNRFKVFGDRFSLDDNVKYLKLLRFF